MLEKKTKFKTVLLKAVISTLVMFGATQGVCAADLVPSQMNSLAESIMEIFTSTFMRVIFGIILAGAGVGFAFNKDNEKVKKNMVAIAIGAGIVVGAQFIADAIMG